MKIQAFSILLLYFVLTIVVFSSVGVWLPLAFDDYDLGYISNDSCRMLSSNLITYSVVIFVTSIVDRIIQLFKKGDFSNNTLEFLILVLFIGGSAIFLAYRSLRALKFDLVNESIMYASFFVLLSWALWFYVKTRDSGYKNYASLGGEFS